MVGIELTTSPLPRVCSTTELHGPAPEILSNVLRAPSIPDLRRELDVVEATRGAHHGCEVLLDHERDLAQVGHIVRGPLMRNVDDANFADGIVDAGPHQLLRLELGEPGHVFGALSFEVVEQAVQVASRVAASGQPRRWIDRPDERPLLVQHPPDAFYERDTLDIMQMRDDVFERPAL